jgi:hypothetical protein
LQEECSVLHYIPSVHSTFLAWAAILAAATVVILAVFAGRRVRRHLARLTVCLAIGAAAAFGVTAWADGQRHAALAAAAHARHGAVSVDGQLAAAFTVITVVVAAIAFAVSALAARRRGREMFAQSSPDVLYGRAARYRRYGAARRDW